MKVDLYEKVWMWAAGILLAAFFAISAVGGLLGAAHPPSHVEAIDPAKVFADPRFRRQGITVDAGGRVHAWVVAVMFAWLPAELTVPAETPVTFHITAIDVTHGFQIVRTNGQAMVVPGYVSQFTTRVDEPGELLIVCNEYCGVGHHVMAAKLKVVPRAEWRPPVAAAGIPVGPAPGHGGTDGSR
jgi:cytochrome c oxidase subunit 2